MIRYLRVVVILAVLLASGLLALACSDDDDGDSSPTVTESADTETPEDGAQPTDDGGSASSGSFDDIPVPPGAAADDNGTFSADDIPFVDPGGDIDPGAYSNIEWRTYDVDISSGDVLDFYQSELSDWEEVYTFDTGPGAFGIWSRNNGDEVLWVGTTDIGEGTELLLIHGTAD